MGLRCLSICDVHSRTVYLAADPCKCQKRTNILGWVFSSVYKCCLLLLANEQMVCLIMQMHVHLTYLLYFHWFHYHASCSKQCPRGMKSHRYVPTCFPKCSHFQAAIIMRQSPYSSCVCGLSGKQLNSLWLELCMDTWWLSSQLFYRVLCSAWAPCCRRRLP